MSRRLNDNISSRYLEAANRLNSKKSRRRIVAYVESYGDIFFWRTVLGNYETPQMYFEVMLPSKGVLERGKKSVLMNTLSQKVGRDLIACVDADYDYVLQGITLTSRQILDNPYVFHTYVYAIENYHCYAQGLHTACVMATLNDHQDLDFVTFLTRFSEVLFPVFVWSVWHYRRGIYNQFSITDLNRICDLGNLNLREPLEPIEHLKRKVNKKLSQFIHQHPDAKESYLALKQELIEQLGITPQTTYLYIQGHHLFDKIVFPLAKKVCDRLRRERENEINRQAVHDTQRRNELSCYIHSLQDVEQMLKKNTSYIMSEPFRRLQNDILHFVQQTSRQEPQKEERGEWKEERGERREERGKKDDSNPLGKSEGANTLKQNAHTRQQQP